MKKWEKDKVKKSKGEEIYIIDREKGRRLEKKENVLSEEEVKYEERNGNG